MATPLVTLNDKHLFNVRMNLERSTSPVLQPQGPAGDRAGRRNHHNYGVVFQPSYHKQSRQEKKFVFTDRCVKCQSHKCNSSKLTIDDTHHHSKRPLSHIVNRRAPIEPLFRAPIQPLFRARFKPLGTHERDRVDKAIYSYITLSSHPYTDIRPYDHRGLSDGNTQLNTRITPDPFDIRYRQLTLTEQLHDNNGNGMDTRQHNLKIEPEEQPRQVKHGGKTVTFITTRTPEPPFQGHLYFNKGRYSPAFTAHNAFLDRIADNIKH